MVEKAYDSYNKKSIEKNHLRKEKKISFRRFKLDKGLFWTNLIGK